jgi:hypothetical protein
MVVGFDLGHAQTAVATVWSDSGSAPAMARLHKREPDAYVHPTAVARYAGQPGAASFTIVGHRCFGMDEKFIAPLPPLPAEGHSAETVLNKDVHLAFKSPDVRPGTRARHATALFVAEVVRQLTEPDPRSGSAEFVVVPPGTKVHWVFGVPSGWNTATCAAYKRLLTETVRGVHPSHEVLVVPESRAAMLASRDQARRRAPGARPGSRTPPPDLRSVLIIDMGSLTTDYTYVADQRAAITDKDIGQLGAGLIDKMLLRLTIDRHEPARDRVLIDRAIDDNYQRVRLEFACRQAKERYFRPAADLTVIEGAALVSETVRASSGERITVPIRVSSERMADILTTPLDGSGRSRQRGWQQAFRSELEAVRDWVGEQARKLNSEPRQSADKYPELPMTVLLTGGASRMPFAQEICREVFDLVPDGEPGRRLLHGEHPEHAIAVGLAIAGRTEHRIAQFRAEAEEFTSERVPELIRKHLPALASELGSIAFNGLVEEQICPMIRRWRNGDIARLEDVPNRVLKARERYLAGPVGTELQENVIAAWYAEVTLLINQEARLMSSKYEIPADWFAVPRSGSLSTDTRASVNVNGALAVVKIIANTMASVMTMAAVVIGALIVDAVLAAALAAAAAAGLATAATPVGPLVATGFGLVAAIGGIWGGKSYLMKKASEADLPVPMRKLGTEDFLLGRVRKRAAKDNLEENGARQYAKAVIAEAGGQIVNTFSDTVEQELTVAARRAAIWIERRDA